MSGTWVSNEPSIRGAGSLRENLFESTCPNCGVLQKSTVRRQGISETEMSEQWGLSKTPTVRNHGYILKAAAIVKNNQAESEEFQRFKAVFVLETGL